MRTMLCAALLVLTATAAVAADIKVGGGYIRSGYRQFISMEGQIGPDDFAVFKLKANRLAGDEILVQLTGLGGNLIAAMQIGEFIRLRGWATYVESECDSACAAIWLAGKPRLAAPKALIGFHAASINGQENGAGNALFGAYMTRLGLGYEAIGWATTAGPDDISYLTPAKAKQIGIDVGMLEPNTKQGNARPTQPPTAKLSPEQIRATFFTGAEFAATTPSGIKFKMRYTADGRALRVPIGNGGSRSEGSWKLDETGYCTTWEGGKPICFTVIAADNNKWSVMVGSAIIATWSK
jgi:hypothetical protein